MSPEDLYNKKQEAIEAKVSVQNHGNSYDNATTVCFGVILLALLISIAGFAFIIIRPDDPTIIVNIAMYAGLGLFGLMIIILTSIRIIQKHRRKPLLKTSHEKTKDYTEAILSTLKNDYGIKPIDLRNFEIEVSRNISNADPDLIIPAVTLNDIHKFNVTLKEVDGNALIFTHYGAVLHKTARKTRTELNPVNLNVQPQNIKDLSVT